VDAGSLLKWQSALSIAMTDFLQKFRSENCSKSDIKIAAVTSQFKSPQPAGAGWVK
tara:strand:+ start:12103 stop:12270 length:168 start_codon:yes stop_codon:yes gene_type:complete